MSRIHIEPPEHWLFHTTIKVYIGDINYGNHLANDAVLRLCHEARLRLLASFGFSEMDIDAALQFQGQSFYGDELNFDLGISELSNTGFSILYRITRVNDGAAIAMVKTGMAFFNYERQRISRTPEAFRHLLAQSN